MNKLILLFLLITVRVLGLSSITNHLPIADSARHWVINTSNASKSSEYQELLRKHGIGLSIIEVDQDEIDADPLSVVVHKASQIGEKILVDDTSMDVEGADVGVNLRWVVDEIPKHAGKKALWRVLLAYREGNLVYVYSGETKGVLVPPVVENESNLEALFLPDESSVTLDLDKPDFLNPRAIAIDAFIKDEPIAILPVIDSWDGPWQNQ